MATAPCLYLHVELIGALDNSLNMFGFGRVGDCNRYGVYFVVVRLYVCNLVIVFAGKCNELLRKAFEKSLLKGAAGRNSHYSVLPGEREQG
jgi:hypothetical protein